MSAQTLTLDHTGYTIKGIATLALWGGGKGYISMDEHFIAKDKLSKNALLGCVNDGQFGCEAIVYVEMDIYDNYGCSVDVFRHSIELDEKMCKMYHKYFFKGI